ncbi:MAG: TerC family protein [Bacteroidales bacterium]|nr:TerC family protein [Bacteroidales bacterium]
MEINGIFFALFLVFIVLMLALDLGVMHRKDREVTLREAALQTLMWVALAAGFACLVWLRGEWITGIDPDSFATSDALRAYRGDLAQQFVAGYLLEESLSIDNIFVMIMIFASFGIEKQYYHRVLFWGIFGAIVLRFIFIFTLGALVSRFAWLLAVFGIVLLYSGVRMMRRTSDENIDTVNHPVVRMVNKVIPVCKEPHGHDFFHRESTTANTEKTQLMVTPLFVVLMVIEFSDIIFAVDSIPAVFSVTRHPMIVYTSNIFAIMGLRSLFFLLSGMAERFWLLHYGLGVLLCFIGAKMILEQWPGWEVPTLASLGVIVAILVLSITLSMLIHPRK